ncbi:MAG TPA: GNAT family N-acetyltransferase [Beijerinckiaceae bacterium]|nr:GNAT family N-acetyltransferase [Methylobacteriaceae bacterium]HRY02355.1 GNAT family N-acetyltransferase [Beijerinckiaceae bacterium]
MPAELTIRIVPTLREVDPSAWDACANANLIRHINGLNGESDSVCEVADSSSQSTPPPSAEAGDPMRPIDSKLQQEPFNPFLTHAFLSSLEESGSATPRTGWSGAHILVENAAGRLLACAPAWLKSHSQGEYVFDHGWADAYERAGGAYYPKLQVAVPFTPVTGRRLLLADDAGAAETAALLQGLRAVVRKTGASSIHITFPTRPEWEALGTAGLLQRTGQQFHFFNRGYGTFDDFLADLASRKRKAIRKERATALAPGIEIEWVTGSDLKEAHWDAFFAFYMDTGSRKWGRPYLTRAFFSLLGERLADRVLLVMAKRGGKYIGGALNLIGDHALYGRNWGAIEEHPCLHFEACYYQAIDFAISKGLKRVEAGAQGEHKLARGYRPVPTYSAHEFANASLARAVSDYLERERRHVAATIEAYEDYAPFRRS